MDSTVVKGTEQLLYQLGDIESVKTFINEAVLEQNQVVSITVLRRLFSTRYGHENEKKIYGNNIKKDFSTNINCDSLKFLKVDGKTPQIVVNSDGLNSTTIVKDKNMVLPKAAEYLRNDISEHNASCDTTNWSANRGKLE